MKKMKLVLAVVLIVSLLFGCVGSLGEIRMNADGSGSAVLKLGYTEETIAGINEMIEDEGEKFELADLTRFTHNGVEFYGVVHTFTYEDPAELADTLNLYQEGDTNSVDTGLFSFELGDTLVMKLVTNEETGVVGDGSEEEIDPELAELLAQAAILYEFTFFDTVTQTAGQAVDAIRVEGNTVRIDYLALSETLDGSAAEFAFSVGNHAIPSAKSASFPDVGQSDWFYDNVIGMANAGLVNGRTSGLFCPNDTMTCAEFIAVAVRAMIGEAGENLLVGEAAPWWDKYYAAAEEMVLLDPELFPYEKMEKPMTREEMAYLAYQMILACYAETDMDINAAIPDWDQVGESYGEAVAYCYAAGILNGMDDAGTFAPKANMSRAQASTVISRVLEQIAE